MFVFVACTKRQSPNSIPVSLAIPIVVVNKQGQNLLDPATPDYFKDGDIKRYDLINGQIKLYHDDRDIRPDWNNGYHIVTPKEMGLSDDYNYRRFIRIYPNTERTEPNPTTTYIDWGRGNRDTLVCSMMKTDEGYYTITEEVWYNHEKVLPATQSPDPAWPIGFLKIVK
ncbi:MAG TPA: hypothetical protein DCQ50_20350 [Chryseobacterium sp.]|nr:hypothetical protein [Chryseobacterium sp.]